MPQFFCENNQNIQKIFAGTLNCTLLNTVVPYQVYKRTDFKT